MMCQKKMCIILVLLALLLILLREWIKKLSTNLFRRIQIENKENTNVKIYKQ